MLTYIGGSQASTFSQRYITQLCGMWLCVYACTQSALHYSTVLVNQDLNGHMLELLSICKQ